MPSEVQQFWGRRQFFFLTASVTFVFLAFTIHAAVQGEFLWFNFIFLVVVAGPTTIGAYYADRKPLIEVDAAEIRYRARNVIHFSVLPLSEVQKLE